MVLNDKDIRERIKSDDLIAIPHYTYTEFPEKYESSIQPCSYDLTLSTEFKRIKKQSCEYPNKSYVDLSDPVEYVTIPYDGGAFDGVVIGAGEFMLGVTNEIVHLPNDVGAMLIPRSSFGRLGLSLEFGNWIDPGYCGALSIQIFNASPNPIRLVAGIRAVQLVFITLTDACESPYHSKYQHSFRNVESRLCTDIIKDCQAI